jgi:hypothetical protein
MIMGDFKFWIGIGEEGGVLLFGRKVRLFGKKTGNSSTALKELNTKA